MKNYIYRRNQFRKTFNRIRRILRFGESKSERESRKRRAQKSEWRRRRWFNSNTEFENAEIQNLIS